MIEAIVEGGGILVGLGLLLYYQVIRTGPEIERARRDQAARPPVPPDDHGTDR
jgi:hypothetical protein